VSKRKPDQVINFRVELQEHERKILDNYLTASSINGFMEALDKLTSFENLYIIATVLELITGKELIPGTPNDVYAIIDAIRDYLKKNPIPEIDKGIIPGVDKGESLFETLFKLTPFGIPFAFVDEVL